MQALPSYSSVAKLIDHALLAPNLNEATLDAGLALARAYDVASVCILGYYVPRAVQMLAGSGVLTTTTVGFPHGGVSAKAKLAEAALALADGADELDAVVNISQVLSGHWSAVREEVRALVDVCHARDKKLKLIFENAYLEETHKLALCELAGELQVDWVKTSTGFAPSAATLADVALMRRHTSPSVAVKAAGGIRDLPTALTFAPFVTRIGTSHTRTILDGLREGLGLPSIAGPGPLPNHRDTY